MYRLQYRISNRHKWRFLSMRKLVPFTKEEGEQYAHIIADRQAPKYVSWLEVQLKQTQD